MYDVQNTGQESPLACPMHQLVMTMRMILKTGTSWTSNMAIPLHRYLYITEVDMHTPWAHSRLSSFTTREERTHVSRFPPCTRKSNTREPPNIPSLDDMLHALVGDGECSDSW